MNYLIKQYYSDLLILLCFFKNLEIGSNMFTKMLFFLLCLTIPTDAVAQTGSFQIIDCSLREEDLAALNTIDTITREEKTFLVHPLLCDNGSLQKGFVYQIHYHTLFDDDNCPVYILDFLH